MSIVLNHRLNVIEGTVISQSPPPATINGGNCTIVSHRNVYLASDAKTLQILIWIEPPVFETDANILNRPITAFSDSIITFLPPPPVFDTTGSILYRYVLPRLNSNDDCQVISHKSYSMFIPKYFWDFGDGSTSTETSPTHEYTKPGRYTVSLTVYDENFKIRKKFTRIKYIYVYTLDHNHIKTNTCFCFGVNLDEFEQNKKQ